MRLCVVRCPHTHHLRLTTSMQMLLARALCTAVLDLNDAAQPNPTLCKRMTLDLTPDLVCTCLHVCTHASPGVMSGRVADGSADRVTAQSGEAISTWDTLTPEERARVPCAKLLLRVIQARDMHIFEPEELIACAHGDERYPHARAHISIFAACMLPRFNELWQHMPVHIADYITNGVLNLACSVETKTSLLKGARGNRLYVTCPTRARLRFMLPRRLTNSCTHARTQAACWRRCWKTCKTRT